VLLNSRRSLVLSSLMQRKRGNEIKVWLADASIYEFDA
jgi:hypothetical protein